MPQDSGLFGSVKRLLATLIGVVATRVELLSNEWEAERLRLLRMFILALLAVFSLCMSTLLLTLFVVLLFWDDHRLAALGVLSLAYLLCGSLLVVLLRRTLRRSRLFSVSLAELQKDRELLGEGHE